uniref:Uncharacterized protein n=1 Tax=Eutreptiella gymnastica TaxID=73025 RepID=A0A7S1NMY0_9EUGL|mmetsp:Transcript_60792/g.108505  ORF Transcript_60792/g.108505 Transcript_60792/m.108505 type:complete len:104 (+) Transcript_60792:53-364(+)
MRKRMQDCKVSASSTLILDGDITVQKLDLDGCLIVRAVKGAKVTIKRLTVRNAGWKFAALDSSRSSPEYLSIRGYQVRRPGQRILYYTQPGDYVVDESTSRCC